MPNKRQIKYTGKDFSSLKHELENLAKQYFPDQFSNFNDYSIEMMLIEMMAYTGDVLSFNIDENFKQLFQKYAYEPEAIFRNAKERGYIPETVSVAIGEVLISQIVPAKIEDGEYKPDTEFAGVVNRGSVFSDYTGESQYITIELCDMRDYEDFDLEEVDTSDNPAYFRIFKSVRVRSGSMKVKTFSLTDPESNLRLFVDENIAYIDSVEDSEGNDWYQVDYLAEDTVFEAIENINFGETFDTYKDVNPYILRLRRASRRFVVEHNSRGECFLQFGQGSDIISDELRNLTARDLLSTNKQAVTNISNSFIIENFLTSDSYGLVPYDVDIIVKYVTSRGDQDNANANTVTNIERLNLTFPNSQNETIENSFTVTNLESITGARFLNDPEFVRRMSDKAFSSQRRCVTNKDYIIRTMTMPSKFGNIDKVYAERDYQELQFERDTTQDNRSSKSRTLNIFVLSRNKQGHFDNTTEITKLNLSNFLEKYRVVSDSINILDPYIINIGVDFEFTSRKGFNTDEVILNVSRKIKEYFSTDEFEINQPIVMEELKNKMYEAEGLASINNIEFVNKWNENNGYSGVEYNVSTDGSNYDKRVGILYPPADIGIFELRFPLKDIKGKHT